MSDQKSNSKSNSKSYDAVKAIYDKLNSIEKKTKNEILELAEAIKEVKKEHNLSPRQNNSILWGFVNKLVPDTEEA